MPSLKRILQTLTSPKRIAEALKNIFIGYTFFQTDKKGNLWFGFNNSRKAARIYNSWKKSALKRKLDTYYSNGFRELLDQQNKPATEIKDAWAVDTSHTLPHLEELVNTATRLYQNEKDGGSGRANYFIFKDHKDLLQYPVFYDFATSPQMLSIIADYLQCVPVLSNIDMQISKPTDFSENRSAVFHLDRMDKRSVRVVIHLNDVDEDAGPFCFLPLSVSIEASKKLRYGKRGVADIVPDAEMYQVINESELVKGTYPKGTVMFVDTGRCFHYGSRNRSKERLVSMITYNSITPENYYESIQDTDCSSYLEHNPSKLAELVISPQTFFNA